MKIDPLHIHITPVGFWGYAEDYYSASLLWKSNKKYSPVPYFLVCRSIELAIKAFLLAKGENTSDLKHSKKYGHDLIKILERAMQLSLSNFIVTSEKEKTEIEKANEFYKQDKKRFEYFAIEIIFTQDLPDLNVLSTYCQNLLVSIREFIISSA